MDVEPTLQIRLLILIGLGLVLAVPSPASAQRLTVGGAIQRDSQRFSEDVVPTRLDGSSVGWTVSATSRVFRHLVLMAEWSDAGNIVDERTLRLDVNGRNIAITSTLRHRTRAWSTLAGYGHDVGQRMRLAYLVGAAFNHVRREFRSDAGSLVLVSPSNPSGATAPPIVDRFRTVVFGADVSVRLISQLHGLINVRAQPLDLGAGLTGSSVRAVVGAGWTFP